jgi:lipoprotein-anchoring transpeptidase ErfK/SrfK
MARAAYVPMRAARHLFRIHGTNQPEHINGRSSGCIRDQRGRIDLYKRVEMGAIVVVRRRGVDSPYNARRNGPARGRH